MTTITYALMILSGLLIVGAAVAALRSRRTALILIAAALASGIAGGVLAFRRIEGPVGPNALARIRHAAARDPGTDAMAQTLLQGAAQIDPAGYAALRDVYMRDTGRDLNKEPVR